MLKINSLHKCHQAPIIVKVPKPFKKSKNYDHTFDWTLESHSNSQQISAEHFNMPDPRQKDNDFQESFCPSLRQNFIRASTIEMRKPVGDMSESLYLSCQQMESSQTSRTKAIQKNQPQSKSKLPISLQPSVLLENQILKVENEKLKQLCDLRKSQIEVLRKEVLSVKCDLSNLFSGFETQQKHSINQLQKQWARQFIMQEAMLNFHEQGRIYKV